MAEIAQDVIAASDVPEKEVSNTDNANGTIAAAEEKQEAVAEKTGAATEQTIGASEDKTDGTAPAEVKAEPEAAVETKKEEVKKDDAKDIKSESQSPDRKRKEHPVSVSAHDRNDRNKRGRGGARGGSKVKTRFEEQPESNDPDEIRRQVEFYFSDSNLPIDAYLLNETGGHKNRPVPLKVIHNFKRMRHFQPYQLVRDAIAESKFLNLDERDEITRKKPLNEKFTDDANANRALVHSSSMPRSIYAKGFGEESKTTALDIEAFFEPYGPINSVRLRRKDDGEFKGSVFVEFEDEETQQKFMELDPKPQWDGKDLEIMSKQEYVDVKHEGILEGTVQPKSQEEYRHRGNDRRSNKEHFDKDDWKSRRNRDQGDDRRHGRGGRDDRGRGRGRGDRGGRGGRGRGRDDRGGRRRSPDFRNRRDGDDDAPPRRAEAEAKKMKTEGDDAAQTNGGAEANAGEAKQAKAEVKAEGADAAVANGKGDAPPAGAAKKRAREDDGEAGGDAKKAKEGDAA